MRKPRAKKFRVLVAPCAFKESLSPRGAAEALRRGWQRGFPGCAFVICPLADGGDGTLETLVPDRKNWTTQRVAGPRGKPIRAAWGRRDRGRTAVIEMARASGLALLKPAERRVLKASTFGTGELIRRALDAGCRKIWVGLGGSATCDGGAGMAQSLGYRFLDCDRREITHPIGGGDLIRIESIEPPERTRFGDAEIIALCDVTNPLLGAEGTARVFAPQKGANRHEVRLLEKNLLHFARLVEDTFGPRGLSVQPFTGAAGGLAFGLAAFLRARLVSGSEFIARALGLPKLASSSDVILTGEGAVEAQTLRGKGPLLIAHLGRAMRLPVICFCGRLDSTLTRRLHREGFTAFFPLAAGPREAKASRRNAALRLELAA